MADWVEPGKKAPDFTLPADDGTKVKLSSLRGQPVVVYFYPRDDTPGCTREACAMRDRKDELARLGAKVLGISTDDIESHAKFRDKFSSTFRSWPTRSTGWPRSTAPGGRRPASARPRWASSGRPS